MGARVVIALILCGAVFGVFWFSAKPDEAKKKTADVTKVAKEKGKKAGKTVTETAKAAPAKAQGWFKDNWMIAAGGTSVVILLICLFAGGKKDKKGKKKKNN